MFALLQPWLGSFPVCPLSSDWPSLSAPNLPGLVLLPSFPRAAFCPEGLLILCPTSTIPLGLLNSCSFLKFQFNSEFSDSKCPWWCCQVFLTLPFWALIQLQLNHELCNQLFGIYLPSPPKGLDTSVLLILLWLAYRGSSINTWMHAYITQVFPWKKNLFPWLHFKLLKYLHCFNL